MADLPSALEFWSMNDSEAACRMLYERVSRKHFPTWASRILKLAQARLATPCPPVERLLRLIDHPQEWRDAHDAFSELRKVVLKLDKVRKRTSDQELLLTVLVLVEKIAKVIYNLSDPVHEFNEDAGWQIPAFLREIAIQLKDEDFKSAAWSALLG